ncbi:MAG: hypothetical protein MUE52_04220 [Tabrizicola sp.]|jgi:hypothetical protein|nr:hypothetical protein [Tabrizicola sp.]
MSARMTLAALVVAAATCPVAADDDPVFKNSDWVIETATSLTIMSDGGGNIDDYADLIADLGRTEVRILGSCKSSCTMFLGMPNVCVSPDAVFGFHGPRSGDQSIRYLLSLVDKIASHHPEPIAEKFRSDWGLTRDFTWLTGAEVLAMVPGLKTCGTEGQR